MEKKEVKSTTKPRVSADTIQGPMSVYIQNSQDGKTIIIKSDIKKVK